MTELPLMLVAAALGVSVSVADGDTLTVSGERIRIANIDAPELHRPQCDAERRLAVVAKRRLENLLAGQRIMIVRGDPATGRKIDRHGRTLAVLLIDGKDVGSILIEEGLARPWTGRRAPWCSRP